MPKKRSRQESSASYKTKRARTSYKPRTAKHKTRRTKIGAYSGALIASKPVKMAKPGSRIRRRQFGQVSTASRQWIGANSIQSEYYFFSLVAEGIVANMLKRLNDTRSDKEAPVPSSFLTRVQMNFMRDEHFAGGTADSSKYVDIDLVNDTSFNGIVYNTGTTASPNGNPVVIDGSAAPNNTGLNKIIYDLAIEGYYPEGIFAFRGVPGSTELGPEILRDTQLGRMTIKLDISSRHKFQNVTPAGTDGGVDMNVNAIDANPLEGHIMTFRNLAPTWNKGWKIRQGTDIDLLDNFSGRPVGTNVWDYKQLNATASGDVRPLPDINEFEAMPLRPSTVFSNAGKKGVVRFPPGGFKVFTTKFTYDGPLRKLVRDITQISSDGADGKYPPMGSSFLMCLLPTIKTTGDEAVTVAFDYVTDGKVHCSMYRGGSLPTTNFIEWGGPAPDLSTGGDGGGVVTDPDPPAPIYDFAQRINDPVIPRPVNATAFAQADDSPDGPVWLVFALVGGGFVLVGATDDIFAIDPTQAEIFPDSNPDRSYWFSGTQNSFVYIGRRS